jgi:hypothetical protein
MRLLPYGRATMRLRSEPRLGDQLERVPHVGFLGQLVKLLGMAWNDALAELLLRCAVSITRFGEGGDLRYRP